MTRIRRTALLLVGALVLTIAAACGSSGSGGPSSGGGVTSPPNTVTIKDFSFHPETLSVAVGTKVTFTNEDTTTHTVRGTGASALINSSNLNKGQSYSVTFTKKGTYSYICSIHPYMKGTITVT